jgi:hypothetical protein
MEGGEMLCMAALALYALRGIVLAQPSAAQNNAVGGALLGGGLGAIIGGARPATPAGRSLARSLAGDRRLDRF